MKHVYEFGGEKVDDYKLTHVDGDTLPHLEALPWSMHTELVEFTGSFPVSSGFLTA
jgi:hypothetical protein